MLRVGNGLTSLDTHCFGSVSDGAESTELGMVDSNADVGTLQQFLNLPPLSPQICDSAGVGGDLRFKSALSKVSR